MSTLRGVFEGARHEVREIAIAQPRATRSESERQEPILFILMSEPLHARGMFGEIHTKLQRHMRYVFVKHENT